MLLRLMVLGVCGGVLAQGQASVSSTDAPHLQELLARVVTNVAQDHATLPSITADEDITSSLSQHGLYRAHGTAHATLRVSPGKPGQQLNEARTYLVLDGKAVQPGKKVAVPFELNGAFSRVADTFFSLSQVSCYSFTLLPVPSPDGSRQLAFATASPLPGTCKNGGTVVTGLARVDAATAQIRHVERTIPAAGEGHHTTFLAIDYAPTSIGGQSVWLPTSLTAELDYGKGSFAARYSNYHRYTGTVTIVPGVTEVETGTPEPSVSAPVPPPE